MPVKRLSILGLGLLGGSLALAARNRIKGCRIVGYAHRRQTLEAALAAGMVDEGLDEPVEAVTRADLVVLCTPVSMLSPLLKQIAASLPAGAIVTDVGSTKRSVVEAGETFLRPDTHFVGSHPMAGSEKRGVQFARENLFDGSLCITTPTSRTDPPALKLIESFWRAVGMRTSRLTPDEHDMLLADISHLPHAVAAALVSMQQERALELCGKGFIDMTRIASGDAGLWRDILLDNRANVRQSVQRLIGSLRQLDQLLGDEASEELRRWLDTAAHRRQRLDHARPDPTEP